MPDQPANPQAITGQIIEVMIECGLAAGGDAKKRAEDVATAFKTIYEAVSHPAD